MKKSKTASNHVGTLEAELEPTHRSTWFFDKFVLAVLACCIFGGFAIDARVHWTADRIVLLAGTILGFVGLIRNSVLGVVSGVSPIRGFWIVAVWVGAMLSAACGFRYESSQLLEIACCFIVTGWSLARLRSEPVSFSIYVGVIVATLPTAEVLERLGYFESVESFARWMTSLFASLMGQTNVQVDHHLLFRQFTADRFDSLGRWDGVLSCLGIGIFCVLAFRRRLVSAILTLVASVMVWPIVISASYITLSFIATESELLARSTWSYYIQGISSVLGVMMIFFVDQFVATVFKPIPSKLLPSESPFFSLAWNWVCGLPNPIYRSPNVKPSLDRGHSKSGKVVSGPTLRSEFRWLRRELFYLIVKPFRAISSSIDAVRSWRTSRRWSAILISAPAALVVMIVYLALPLSISMRDDLEILRFKHESLGICATQALETVSLESLDRDFIKAIGGVDSGAEWNESASIPKSTRRYVELLSRRILSIEPKSQITRYRLGLILYLDSDIDNAEKEMQGAASRELSQFPQADAWLAKNLVIKKAAGQSISESELHLHLANACKTPGCDFRLLFLYSSLLEAKGSSEKSVEMAKMGVKARPEAILDLARLCARLGDSTGRIAAAKKAEVFFETQLSLDDNEQNRLAISDARLLGDQLAKAAEILEDGIVKNIGSDKSRRQLSEIQRMLYLRSIGKNANDEVDADLCFLEKAIDSDHTNPNISSEVAKLLAIKRKPSKKLLDALQSQINSGISTAACHLILAEKYYAKGRLNEAKEHWELAVRKEPNNVTALNNLATCLTAISPSNANRSIELVAIADSLSPNNADILDTWGEVSMVANRPRDAVNKFEMAIKNDTKRIDIRRKLVDAYRAAGLNAMAITQLKLVQSLESEASKTDNSR